MINVLPFDLKDVISRMPGNIYWKNIEGYYLGCNENVATMLRLSSPTGIIGKTIYELMPPEMAKAHDTNDQKVFSTGHELVVEEHSIGLDQKPAIYLSRKVPLFNNQGEVVGLLGMSQDISLYKQRENALVDAKDEAERNLSEIVSFLPGNIYWKDTEHRYLGCNENLAKVCGVNNSSEMIGKRNCDFPNIKNDIALAAELNDKKVLRSGEEMIFEEQGQDTNGQEAVYLSRKIPLYEGNKIKGTLGVSLDITQRKKEEQELNDAKKVAELAIQAKSDFFMNMSHDLKTPLTGVIGILDILMHKDTDEATKELLSYAYTSSQKLLNIINDVFDVVSEGVHKPVNYETVDLRKILNDTYHLLKPEVLRKKLDLQLHIDPAFQTKIINDRARLEKLLLNIITNAVKYTDQGYINVYLNVLNKTDDNITFELIVEDSGCGVEQAELDTVFDKFSRSSQAKQQNTGGSGLGLWMVKNIIDSLKGDIKMTSAPGKGTTVTCVLSAQFAHHLTPSSP